MEIQVKKIENFNYAVSNRGNVTNLKNHRPIAIQCKEDGYPFVTLSQSGLRKTIRLNQLVSTHFIENPDGKSQIMHIDGNTRNCSANNLKWVTQKENTDARNAKNKVVVAEPKPRKIPVQPSARPVVQMDLDGNDIKTFKSGYDAAKTLGIECACITQICNKNKKRKTTGGFKFRWLNEIIVEENPLLAFD